MPIFTPRDIFTFDTTIANAHSILSTKTNDLSLSRSITVHLLSAIRDRKYDIHRYLKRLIGIFVQDLIGESDTTLVKRNVLKP